jgi:hypothetical protein
MAHRDRYAWYELLARLAGEAEGSGNYDLALALHALAHLVLTEREATAAGVLRHLPVRP